ncbi:MAG: hypothetical protein ALAOOOJD_01782 [bacterium]|nr:hypothetical protein [bacterium]
MGGREIAIEHREAAIIGIVAIFYLCIGILIGLPIDGRGCCSHIIRSHTGNFRRGPIRRRRITLIQRQLLIRRQMIVFVQRSGRPFHHQTVQNSAAAQTEMRVQITAGAEIALPSDDGLRLRPAIHPRRQFRADAVEIAPRTAQPEIDPMVERPQIFKQDAVLSRVCEKNVEITVVIIIRHRGAVAIIAVIRA